MNRLPNFVSVLLACLLVMATVQPATAADPRPEDSTASLIDRHREFLANQGATVTNSVATTTNTVSGAVKWLTSMDQLDDVQRLGPADVVSFRVIEDREEPVQVPISDTGEMTVPYIGRVAATGRTCRELARVIKELLEEKYYHQATPIVAVDVLNRSRGKVYLVGSVRSTGSLDIPSNEEFTVTRAILRAGGFSEFANQQKVRVLRRKPADASGESTYEQLVINVEEILEKGRLERDLPVRADDLIYVPTRYVNF